MADNTVSIDTNQPQENTVSIDTGGSPAVSQDTASMRAVKARFGMADFLPTKTQNDYYRDISTGQEWASRTEAGSAIDAYKAQGVSKHVARLAGLPLDPEDKVQQVQQAVSNAMTPVDPRSVFEEAYSKEFVNGLNKTQFGGQGFWNDVNQYQPTDKYSAMGQSVDTIAYTEYLYKRMADVQDAMKRQSIAGAVWDQAKGLFQPYADYQLTGHVTVPGTAGSQAEQWATNTNALPFDQFKNEVDKVVDEGLSGIAGGNPMMTMARLQYLAGVTTGQVHLDNTFSLFSVGDAAAVGQLGLGITRRLAGLNIARRAARTVTQVATGVNPANGTVTAAARQAIAERPPEVAAASAAGDLKEAAVRQLTKDVGEIKDGTHDQFKDNKQQLISTWRTDVDQLDPGRYGQEFVNTVKNDENNFITKMQNAKDNVMHVERIPEFNADREAVKGYVEDKMKTFPHASLLDYGMPEWNSSTRSWEIPVNLGVKGLYSDHPQQIYNMAKRQGIALSGEPLLTQINEHFGIESSKLRSQIEAIKEDLRTPPRMEDDVNELNRKADLPNKINELEAKLEDLRSWHADKLTEPNIDEIQTKGIPNAAELKNKPRRQFKTAKGSLYTILEDGTTIRDKAARPEHPGDSGIKPKSHETYYLTPEQVEEYQKTRSAKKVGEYSKQPSVGLSPLEIWNKQGNQKAAHLGNEITEVINPGSGVIRQQGKGWYLQYNLPVDETHELVRDSLLSTPDAKYPNSAAKKILPGVRTPEETLSKTDNMNRKVVDYAKSRWDEIMKENAQYINDLFNGRVTKDPVTGQKITFPKTRAAIRGTLFGGDWKDWLRTVDAARRLPDADGLPGKFFTPEEFDNFYQTHYKRLPEPIETAAYQAFKRHYEMDLQFRRMMLARNVARLGAETHIIHSVGPDGIVSSPPIVGVRMDHIPRGGGMWTVDMRGGYGNERIIRTGGTAFSSKWGEQLDKDVQEGRATVIQPFNPEKRELRGFGKIRQQLVRYVIAPRVETRPLDIENLLSRRGAGHIEYDHKFAVKQANMTREVSGKTEHWNYEGDTVFTLHDIRQEAMDVAGHANKYREYLANDDTDGARKYLQDHMDIPHDELYKQFKATKDEETGQVNLPHLNLHEPFVVVPKGETIGNMSNDLANRYKDRNFHDITRGGSLARTYTVEFTAERDADGVYTIHNYGTRQNPVWRYEEAKMVDPMTTMSRSLNSISNTMQMDDMKITGVERWIKEAGDYLNVGDKADSDLKSSPFYHFYKSEFKRGFVKDDNELYRALMNRKYQLQSLIGQPTDWDKAINSIANKLTDWMYRHSPVPEGLTIGTNRGDHELPLGRAVQLAPSWMLHTVNDAGLYARTVVSHATLGMFNIAQLLAQGANYATLFGLKGPVKAGQATLDAIMHEFHRINPRFLDMWDAHTSNMGGLSRPPGQFKEATQEYFNSGMNSVGAEHAMLGQLYKPGVVSHLGTEYLNGAELFFKGMERFNRLGAWYEAFNSFRDANPTKTLTNLDRQKILYEANQAAGNMTRSSRSWLQKGAFAYPAQFMTYQLRLAELMTGTSIGASTPERTMQRARMFATYGALFGIPAATGLAAFPFGYYARKWAINNGYVVGDKWWQSLLMEGIPATTLAFILGKGDLKDPNTRIASGPHINIGERFGSPGFDQITDALNADVPWMRLLSGATGSKLLSLRDNTNEVRRAAFDSLTGRYKPGQLTEADVADILNPIQSWSYGRRALVAAHTGRWYSQNGTLLMKNVGPVEALLMGMTGTQPQEVSDIQKFVATRNDDVENQRYFYTQFNRQYQRYLQALVDNDPELAERFRNKWDYYLKYLPDEKQPDAIARANQEFNPLIQRIPQQVLLKNVPPENTMFGFGQSRKDVGLDTFKRMERVQQLRERNQ